MRPRFARGIAFEKKILEALKDPLSEVNKKLRELIPDFDQRIPLQKVYLCIVKESCNVAGGYFIADFAFAKKIVDPGDGSVSWDIVIADSKLTEFTDFTGNQKAGKALDFYSIKTRPKDLYNEIVEDGSLKIGGQINRAKSSGGINQPFYKIYGDNAGVKQGGIDNFKGIIGKK